MKCLLQCFKTNVVNACVHGGTAIVKCNAKIFCNGSQVTQLNPTGIKSRQRNCDGDPAVGLIRPSVAHGFQ